MNSSNTLFNSIDPKLMILLVHCFNLKTEMELSNEELILLLQFLCQPNPFQKYLLNAIQNVKNGNDCNLNDLNGLKDLFFSK